jgi:hypothetical protein
MNSLTLTNEGIFFISLEITGVVMLFLGIVMIGIATKNGGNFRWEKILPSLGMALAGLTLLTIILSTPGESVVEAEEISNRNIAGIKIEEDERFFRDYTRQEYKVLIKDQEGSFVEESITVEKNKIDFIFVDSDYKLVTYSAITSNPFYARTDTRYKVYLPKNTSITNTYDMFSRW